MSEHTKRVRSNCEPQLGMTSMIDVVFLLLVFFIVTMEPRNLLAKLPIQRPQPSEERDVPTPPAFTLTITSEGYLANGKRVDLDFVDGYLEDMNSKFGMDAAMIICHSDSDHSKLVRALDIFMKNSVTNLSLSSR